MHTKKLGAQGTGTCLTNWFNIEKEVFMKDVIARLKEHQSPTPSKWRERAEWRMQNKSWLRHSQRIAVKMLEKMDELSMTQKQLADMMGCSQQYVSKVLKGQENLSLETMSKIEDCLHISILQEELEMA